MHQINGLDPARFVLLPCALGRLPDRVVMLPAAGLLGGVLLAFAANAWGGVIGWPMLLANWLTLGFGYFAAQTRTSRLLRRSATPVDRPTVFAAQFALSHVAWLLTYPLAGRLGKEAGIPVTLAPLGGLTLIAVAAAAVLWPAHDPDVVEHAHPEIDPDPPHFGEAETHRHTHAFDIDDLHRRWPAARPG
ncbi:hypothetical protein [Methylorubrum populi]|uniref:Putative NreB protein n=1 Tax=Methylorubrum populi TaxID=223967 RepID=A0A833J602_9HYPH|nr:hypothetical protein [Methylorubrum populi]KAB7783931.1 putative NreB protein [Methylorubrum populi]